MTTKDYIVIAQTITKLPVHMRNQVASEFCLMLAADNPRFDPVKFLTACGVI